MTHETPDPKEDVIEIDGDGVVRALGPQAARDLAGLNQSRAKATPETPDTPNTPTCGLCGEPMPSGEEMFQYHGYSGPCPKPPLPPQMPPILAGDIVDLDGFQLRPVLPNSLHVLQGNDGVKAIYRAIWRRSTE